MMEVFVRVTSSYISGPVTRGSGQKFTPGVVTSIFAQSESTMSIAGAAIGISSVRCSRSPPLSAGVRDVWGYEADWTCC